MNKHNINIMTSKSKKTSKEGNDAFSKHSEQQQQQQQPPSQQQHSNESSNGDFGKMSLKARLLVFIIVPLSTGFLGLAASYLQLGTLNKDNKPHEIDFDADFVTPALLGLAFVIVIGFQTGGFQTSWGGGGGRGGMERKFALSWPKAKRIRKVRRERVIIEDDDDVVGDDLGGEREGKKDR